ncbi:MAG: RNA polymerase sigma factor RpoD/SigA [Chitinispirillaceae bacterium]|nr:RNA polymerase sigma factor RpoD/SigA [Chitinispirillaceae bacterium]
MRLTSESIYFRDINRYRLLTDKEERELVKKVQRNEPGAHDALITANLRFVVSVARGYRGRGVSFLDLINEGNIGLIKAAERFNLSRKVKFISYAVWWIRQSIQRALFEQAGLVRLPVNKISLIRNLKKALDRNRGDYNGTITMDRFRTHENDIVDIMDKIKTVSLDTPLRNVSPSSKESAKTLQDILGEEGDQESESERKELGTALDSVLQNVPSREERVLRMYFGLNYNRQFTLEEIGKELNLTRERVRLIRDKALRHLMGNPLLKARLMPFLTDFKKSS